MKYSNRSMTRGALIAALYCLLTVVFRPISFGAVQFRIAESLSLLPLVCADAMPGLFIGCLLANLLGGAIWYDVVFGALATLLAAICTRALRKHRYLAAAMPALFNGLIVSPVTYLAYADGTGGAVLAAAMATVALGEAAVCYGLGLPLDRVLRRLPKDLLERK